MAKAMMGSGSDRVSSSAITQIKGKIKAEFFQYLFYQINMMLVLCSAGPNRRQRCRENRYQFIAIDGSNLPVPVNFDEPDYIVRRKDSNDPIHAGMHLNLALDLATGLFLDFVFQTQKGKDDRKAAKIIIEHYHWYYQQEGVTPVFIMDRGYFSFSLAEFCCKHGYQYIIRSKYREFTSLFPELKGKEGISDVRKRLSIHQRASDRNDPNRKYISRKAMNEICPGAEEAPFTVRSVSFETEPGKYVCLLTSFIEQNMTPADYSDGYHGRWGTETKIGQLKYGEHVLHIHSKNAEWIKQEVWAGLLGMNISTAVSLLCAPQLGGLEAADEKEAQEKPKYQINLTNVIRSVSVYLQGLWGRSTRSVSEKALIEEICREKSCIRENCSFIRKLHPKRLIWFTWR